MVEFVPYKCESTTCNWECQRKLSGRFCVFNMDNLDLLYEKLKLFLLLLLNKEIFVKEYGPNSVHHAVIQILAAFGFLECLITPCFQVLTKNLLLYLINLKLCFVSVARESKLLSLISPWIYSKERCFNELQSEVFAE